MSNIQLHGLYLIKNSYFKKYADDTWKQDKGGRPYYYAFQDADGMLWMIPLTTKVDKFREWIERVEAQRGKGNCIYYHIGKIAGEERAFNIGDMFPITEKYIKRLYNIDETPYIVKTKNLNDALYSKAMRFLRLLEGGKIKSSHDVLTIKRALLDEE